MPVKAEPPPKKKAAPEPEKAPAKKEEEEVSSKEERGGEPLEEEVSGEEVLLPEFNFVSFIFSISTSALIQLGEIEDPFTQENTKNSSRRQTDHRPHWNA